MPKTTFELKGLCACGKESVFFRETVDTDNATEMDAMELRVDQRGGVDTFCRHCGKACIYAEFWADGQLIERLPPDEMERRGGESAGPLPPKPWEGKP